MKYDRAKARGIIDSYIKSIKKQSMAYARAELGNMTTLEGLLIRYRGINPDARISAEKIYKDIKAKMAEEDLEPDFNNYDDLFQLYNIARHERGQGNDLRKLSPSKQKSFLTTKQ